MSKPIILVVDDDQANRKVVVYALSEHFGDRFEVVSRENGALGLKHFQENPKQIALVVTDLQMPVMGGGELIAEIRKTSALPGIILMSGNSEADITSIRCNAFLEKPFDIGKLLETAEQVLELSGHSPY